MPEKCCAYQCSQTRDKDKNIQLYRIPAESDPDRRSRWIAAIRRAHHKTADKPWEPTKHSRLCSRHFISGVGSSVGVSDSGTNTDPDWEDQVRTMIQAGSRLSQDFNAEKLKQQQDELDFNKRKSDVTKRRDEAIKQHQALLEKLESVRVKLQLNNSKTTRKNFLSKIQEMTSERDRAQEEQDRLAAELAEAESRLSALEVEQRAERRLWDQEVSELRSQTERAQTEARDAERRAQSDERAALERERDTNNERVETWLQQVGVYLSGLRAELPHRYRQEGALWESREQAVKRRQSESRSSFRERLQQLEQGQHLDTLPPVPLPHLPSVPMAELYLHRIMQMTPRNPVPPPHTQAPPSAPPFSPPPAVQPIRAPLLQNLPRHAHFPVQPPPPFLGQRLPPPLHHPPSPRFAVTSLPVHAPPPRAQTPPLATAPPPPAAAIGTLSKILEKLKVQFPQHSSLDLTKLLQQVKTDRGTLAGLSMEEVIDRVRLKVEASAPAAPAPAPAAPAPAPAAPAPRKPCLVCQKPVDPGAKFELNCAHTVHKECIQVWLKSSKSNNCPFCPNKKN